MIENEDKNSGPTYERGDVLLDDYRLYVILKATLTKTVGMQYTVMILALLCDDPEHEHAGQLRHWGDGLQWDEYLGKMELPATL